MNKFWLILAPKHWSLLTWAFTVVSAIVLVGLNIPITPSPEGVRAIPSLGSGGATTIVCASGWPVLWNFQVFSATGQTISARSTLTLLLLNCLVLGITQVSYIYLLQKFANKFSIRKMFFATFAIAAIIVAIQLISKTNHEFAWELVVGIYFSSPILVSALMLWTWVKRARRSFALFLLQFAAALFAWGSLCGFIGAVCSWAGASNPSAMIQFGPYRLDSRDPSPSQLPLVFGLSLFLLFISFFIFWLTARSKRVAKSGEVT